MMDVRVPLFPGEVGRNKITARSLSSRRSYQTSDRGARDRDPAIHPMTPATLGAGRDIDRPVFLDLTQCYPCIEQGGFFETQPECPGDFDGRRDTFVPVLAQLIGTLAHGILIETRRRVVSYS